MNISAMTVRAHLSTKCQFHWKWVRFNSYEMPFKCSQCSALECS